MLSCPVNQLLIVTADISKDSKGTSCWMAAKKEEGSMLKGSTKAQSSLLGGHFPSA